MKLKVKILLTALLALFAAVSLMAVLSDLGVLGTAEPADVPLGAYMLRSWDGYVGVFCPPGADEPTTVTDIRVGDLPLADRLALAGGVAAEDYGQVVRMLEDLSP